MSGPTFSRRFFRAEVHLRLRTGHSVELVVEHADNVTLLVVDFRSVLFVPEHGGGDPAGVLLTDSLVDLTSR